MKQVLIKRGAAIVADVPAPRPGVGEVLVRVQRSCLSVGTELSGIRQSALPIWKKALQQPEKAAAALRMVGAQGLRRTWNFVRDKRDAAHATGYSAAGTVVEVGVGVDGFGVGDRVACAGAQYAYHAEFVRVPRNLCVPVPDEVDWDGAATVTLGAIALQGVRRAQPTLGECFVVLGLGILGQLTVQLLRANGCRTIGIDIDERRIELARQLGLDVAIRPDEDDADQVARLTDGLGADGVVITAATPSDAVVAQAFKVCRKKGRVVLVGDVGLNLNRADFYAKELDFLISTSYGPGRYDRGYEEQGLEYPHAYVRWTENRNLAEYLRLVADKRVRLDPLISARYPIAEAAQAYASLSAVGGIKPMLVLLSYADDGPAPVHTVVKSSRRAGSSGRIRVAVVGAGSFARMGHLPTLRDMSDRFALHAVVTRNGHTATAAADEFGARHAATDYHAVLSDPEVDAVIIATRHDLHAAQTLDALRAGKHVLVEKPLALTAAELDALSAALTESGRASSQVLVTGYNRRFSPYGRRMAELVSRRSAPFMIDYRMNAGYLPRDHWVHGPEGGGRNIGEACHIYDLFTYLADAEAKEISAHSISPRSDHYARTDNFAAMIGFADGSVCTLTYTALGTKDYPKEMADLYVDGKIGILEDYKSLVVHGAPKLSLRTARQEKGLSQELAAFADAIESGEWPIPWWQQLQSSRIALTIQDCLHG